MIPELLVSVENEIACITLNRPDAHNAINFSMWEALPQTLERVATQSKIVIITGQGNSFAAGADLLELEKLQSFAEAKKHWKAIEHCLDYVWGYELPTIAMINGACLGGGCLLSLACDLRYATDSAVFGIPISKLGIVLDDANISRLVSAVGVAHARELLYTGDTISSARAEAIGLINKSYVASELQDKVLNIANTISRNSQESVRHAKQSVKRTCLKDSQLEKDQFAVIDSYLQPEFKQRLQWHLAPKA